jgi:serine protease inhibitor
MRSNRPARAPKRGLRAKFQFVVVLVLSLILSCGASAQAEAPLIAPLSPVPDAISNFGFRLLRTLVRSHGSDNVIVSPLSVSLALSIAYNGAAGDTKAAMAKTLGIPSLNDDDFNHANHGLTSSINQADPAVQMEIANALWAQSGFTINPEFFKLSRDWYSAPVGSLDFANPQHAADVINAWVDKNTHGKISRIVDRVERTDGLLVTDAFYFKGPWSFPFNQEATKPRDFHLQNGGSVKAPLMDNRGEYPYFENDAFQAIRLPYGNERFAMLVFLPRKNKGLSNFLASLDRAHWAQWKTGFSKREGSIILPKLELSWGTSLNDALKSMGMAVAFNILRADFSRIHPPQPSRLFISDVEHKTLVKVDEEGTEAAAATDVEMTVGTLISSGGPRPFEMIVDHPFFFAIAEQESDALLFAGVVMDPTRRN